MKIRHTEQNIELSPNFLVLKFRGNWAVPQNFYIEKLGEITVFYAATKCKSIPAFCC